MAGPEDDDGNERLTDEEAKAIYWRLVLKARKRGGTKRGEILVDVVNGRRLS